MQKIKSSVCLGAGYGDEGKGNFTAFLSKKYENSLVVRFSGGHNAGHTVVDDSFRHVFSSFGSGTLYGRPTFTSKYCTVFPTAVVNEYNVLKEKMDGSHIFLHIDPMCPITTPYDIYHNQSTESVNRHGSVGVGLGSTHRRQEAFYKLHAMDLYFPVVYKAKLANIAKWYGLEDLDISGFLEDIEKMVDIVFIQSFSSLIEHGAYSHVIFEGSQGILLDQDFGFFPNVTRSHTTSRNAMEMIAEVGLEMPDVYYITRAYSTRHGNGFMSGEGDIELINNELETNVSDEWQGNFRTGILNFHLLDYAIDADFNYSKDVKHHLVVTCLDQVSIEFKVEVAEGDIRWFNVEQLHHRVGFGNLYTCDSPDMNSIKEVKLEIA